MTEQEAKQKLVALARSELGYREGANNWNKYAADPMIAKLYGWVPQNQPWCCVFVNWCYLTAFGYDVGSGMTYGGTAACANSAELFRKAGAFVHFPQVGDQAFYYSGNGINHTGIVVSVDGTEFYAVEGNYSDRVSLVRHNVGKADVAGFGRPNWKLAESSEFKDQSSKTGEQEKADTEDHRWTPKLLRYSNTYSGDCVVLQAILNVRHFPCGSADGFFGAKTQAAVTKAQRYYGLTVDGICGPQTWEKLLGR